MATPLSLLFKAAVFVVILIFSQSSVAQVVHHGQLSASSYGSAERFLSANPDRLKKNALVDTAAATGSSEQEEKLQHYLQDLGLSGQQYNYQSKKKFYYHLANVFVRLRLYPLAMKCFFKAIKSNTGSTDSLTLKVSGLHPIQDGALAICSADDAMVGLKTQALKDQLKQRKQKGRKSRPTSFSKISGNFDDGKKAVAYALLLHVKQPAPGKRKIFVWTNTGHTFITLIKYNTDSTFASASFGFYPDKDQLLSATPVAPTTSAVFKDDAAHLWDEIMGKFISHHTFQNILELTRKFEGMTYNLNDQNCTDFGLQAAGLAGIHIGDTFGKWPFGRGNNPAVTGQSILEGNIGDRTNEDEVFIDHTVDDPLAAYN
ncbi:hypothetical protein ACSBL2_19110 [Pedobacter sp. AW31-3R]|uniref:hypothetical protein n=1 Tax=Pedobacter sp. AW31-3R TaxID=3445781 RepID=UPI003F9F8A03